MNYFREAVLAYFSSGLFVGFLILFPFIAIMRFLFRQSYDIWRIYCWVIILCNDIRYDYWCIYWFYFENICVFYSGLNYERGWRYIENFYTTIASAADDYITGLVTNLPTVLAVVIPFAVGVLLFSILKKWLFGSAGRV